MNYYNQTQQTENEMSEMTEDEYIKQRVELDKKRIDALNDTVICLSKMIVEYREAVTELQLKVDGNHKEFMLILADVVSDEAAQRKVDAKEARELAVMNDESDNGLSAFRTEETEQ